MLIIRFDYPRAIPIYRTCLTHEDGFSLTSGFKTSRNTSHVHAGKTLRQTWGTSSNLKSRRRNPHQTVGQHSRYALMVSKPDIMDDRIRYHTLGERSGDVLTVIVEARMIWRYTYDQ